MNTYSSCRFCGESVKVGSNYYTIDPDMRAGFCCLDCGVELCGDPANISTDSRPWGKTLIFTDRHRVEEHENSPVWENMIRAMEGD